jgi:hypothetical protein
MRRAARDPVAWTGRLPQFVPLSGTKDRAGQARLSLAELDAAVGAFIVTVYNHRAHSETGQPPQARWEAGGFLPRLPESLDQLDLLLLTVAKPRKIHPDGIRFQGLRYLDPVLAAYVGESVIIRYDPRDLAEIRVFHRGRLLGRAICPDLAAATVSLKEITAARSASPGAEKADQRACQRCRPVGCQKSGWPLSCSDGPGPAVRHDDHPCPCACSTSSSSGSAAGWSCSAVQRLPKTPSCSCCGTRSLCCAGPIPGPGSTGPTAQSLPHSSGSCQQGCGGTGWSPPAPSCASTAA